MRIKRVSAEAMMDAIVPHLTLKLAQQPAVINIPPSHKSQYPAVAVLFDEANVDVSNDDQDLEIDPTKSPGDDGYLLTGFFRTDPVTNDYVSGDTYKLDVDTTISMVGTIHMSGRFWVGARLEEQRSQLEQDVIMVFYNDRVAPGRLQVSVAGVEINGLKIPFGIGTILTDDKIKWNAEYAFSERLWTYLPFKMDVPLLIPRTDPIAEQLLLTVSTDLQTPVSSADDINSLSNSMTFSVAQDGSATGV